VPRLRDHDPARRARRAEREARGRSDTGRTASSSNEAIRRWIARPAGRNYAVGALVFAACGGASAEAPITVDLGLTHDQTERALAAHQYCRKPGEPAGPRELYPRCDRPAAEWGESWITASFDGDRLVELRRWERYADQAHALERWNELVTARSKASQPSDEALQELRDKGLLEAGTRAVKAFRGSDAVVIGVYLLTPTPPENASVLEKISYVH